MLTYSINGRTLVYRAPSSEEQTVIGALLDAGFHVAVRSDVYRRWPTVDVRDREHLAGLFGSESVGDRNGWEFVPSSRSQDDAGRPTSPGWYKDGHPAEAAVLDELARSGAVAVGPRRTAPGTRFIIGPGDKVRGKPGRRQRYWKRFAVPSDGINGPTTGIDEE